MGQSAASTPMVSVSAVSSAYLCPSAAAARAMRPSARPPPTTAILPQLTTLASAYWPKQATASSCTRSPSAPPACQAHHIRNLLI